MYDPTLVWHADQRRLSLEAAARAHRAPRRARRPRRLTVRAGSHLPWWRLLAGSRDPV